MVDVWSVLIGGALAIAGSVATKGWEEYRTRQVLADVHPAVVEVGFGSGSALGGRRADVRSHPDSRLKSAEPVGLRSAITGSGERYGRRLGPGQGAAVVALLFVNCSTFQYLLVQRGFTPRARRR